LSHGIAQGFTGKLHSFVSLNHCLFDSLSFTLVLDFVLSVPGKEGDPEMTPTLSQTTRELLVFGT
jgi:hypothetical protein